MFSCNHLVSSRLLTLSSCSLRATPLRISTCTYIMKSTHLKSFPRILSPNIQKMLGYVHPVCAMSSRVGFSRALCSAPVNVPKARSLDFYQKMSLMAIYLGGVITGMFGLLGIHYMIKSNIELDNKRMIMEERKMIIDDPVKKLGDILQVAMFKKDVEHFIPVPKVADMRVMFKKKISSKKNNPTFMICGPRGVGKTTVVAKALEDEAGVIHIPLDPCTVDNFYSKILECTNDKYSDINKATLVRKALKYIKESGGKKPTFVVDVNDKTDSEELFHLIIEMKTLGSEEDLANFFVDVSTSRASLLIPLSLFELRVWTLYIDDPCEQVTRDYLNKSLKDLLPDCMENEIKPVIEQYVQSVGTRFLDAHHLMTALSEKEFTLEEAKQEASRYMIARKLEYERAFQSFTELFCAVDKQRKKKLWTDLLRENLELKEASRLINISEREFIARVSKFNPRPVYIHPGTRKVIVGNFIARKNFEKEVNNL